MLISKRPKRQFVRSIERTKVTFIYYGESHRKIVTFASATRRQSATICPMRAGSRSQSTTHWGAQSRSSSTAHPSASSKSSPGGAHDHLSDVRTVRHRAAEPTAGAAAPRALVRPRRAPGPARPILAHARLRRTVDKSAVSARIPAGVRQDFDTFVACEACAKVYWAGSHYDRMQAMIADLRADSHG